MHPPPPPPPNWEASQAAPSSKNHDCSSKSLFLLAQPSAQAALGPGSLQSPHPVHASAKVIFQPRPAAISASYAPPCPAIAAPVPAHHRPEISASFGKTSSGFEIVSPSDPSGDSSSDCGTKKNLDCIKYLARNADSLCSLKNNLFVSTIECLLDPVYSCVSKKNGTALDCNLMPGGTTGSTGGRMSPGRSSASCFREKSLGLSSLEGEDCGDNSSPPKKYQCANYKPGNDVGIKEVSVRSRTPQRSSVDRSSPFFNSKFPNVSLGYCANDEAEGAVTSTISASELKDMIGKATTESKALTFSSQSLLTFLQSGDESRDTSINQDPSLIDALLLFERNFDGQIYMSQDLLSSGHCTIATGSASSFFSKQYHKESTGSKSSGIPYLFVPRSSNYLSPDGKIMVVNAGAEDGLDFCKDTCIHDPISTVSDLVLKMFVNHLSESFRFDNKKRSTSEKVAKVPAESARARTKRGKRKRGKSKAKQSPPEVNNKKDKHVMKSNFQRSTQREVFIDPQALPVISLGWSTIDCNEYGSNQSTIAGNIKPFIKDGNLPKLARRYLIELIKFVLSWIPGDWAFNVKKNDDEVLVKLRCEMMADFKEKLGGDRDIQNFRVEGVTIVIPLSIGYHKDTLNCFSEGMRTVLSINCKVPLNERTIPSGRGSKLWIWLEKNGYHKSFPCSIILYTRKTVFSYCHKMSLSHRLGEKDIVHKCMLWALIDRVNSVVDYRARVWNNPSFPTYFKNRAVKKKGSRFGGLMWATPASYDKMVSHSSLTSSIFESLLMLDTNSLPYQKQCHYSFFIYAFLDFHANLCPMTIGDTLDYICFCAIQCNGTSVMAEIHRIVMANLKKARKRYSKCTSMFTFLCWVFKKCFPNNKNAIGSCSDPRFTYSGGSSKTNWSNHRSDFLKLFHPYYENESVIKNRNAMSEITSSIIVELLNAKDPSYRSKKKFCGIGTMGAVQFIHLSALLGIIPLFCYTFGELHDDKLGPPNFIRLGLGKDKNDFTIKECNDYMQNMQRDLSDIWGHQVTPCLVENTLCELSRCYKKTVASLKLKKSSPGKPGADVIMDPSKMVDGEKNDVIFYDEKRRKVQNFFIVSLTNPLRPELIMKKSEFWGDHNSKANVCLTNNSSERKGSAEHLKWDSDVSNRDLNTSLSMSRELMEYFRIVEED